MKLRLFLSLLLFPFWLSAADTPPVIYVMDFSTAQAKIDLGQNAPVSSLFGEIAAMTLSNDLVKQLSKIAPAKRITRLSEAKAPGWLLRGNFQSITRKDSIAVTGLYKMTVIATLSDLSSPGQNLATFTASSETYQGNESNQEADDGPGMAPEIPQAKAKSEGDKIAAGLSTDSARAAKSIGTQLLQWMSGK